MQGVRSEQGSEQGDEQEKKEQNEGGSASAKKDDAKIIKKKTSVEILLASKGFLRFLKEEKKKNKNKNIKPKELLEALRVDDDWPVTFLYLTSKASPHRARERLEEVL